MNEELKPGARSSGLVQGKNKQDDRFNFAVDRRIEVIF